MSSSSESQRRQARDAALRTQDDVIAEHLSQALKSGELKSAPGWGKPLPEPEGWNETPEEFRMPFKILKNAGIVPPEVEMFHERARVREQLEASTDAQERVALRQRLSEIEQAIALRLEGMRASGKV